MTMTTATMNSSCSVISSFTSHSHHRRSSTLSKRKLNLQGKECSLVRASSSSSSSSNSSNETDASIFEYDLTYEEDIELKKLESFYKFPLDEFQRDATRVLIDGHSLVVSAPTGSGKTLIGETAIMNCLLYTSPSPRDGLLSRMPSSA